MVQGCEPTYCLAQQAALITGRVSTDIAINRDTYYSNYRLLTALWAVLYLIVDLITFVYSYRIFSFIKMALRVIANRFFGLKVIFRPTIFTIYHICLFITYLVRYIIIQRVRYLYL